MSDTKAQQQEGEDPSKTNTTTGMVRTGKPFRPVRAPARGKPGRGFAHDPDVICDALMETWEEFSEALSKLPDGEKDSLAQYFNELTDDDPELGDSLLSDLPEFKLHLDGLTEENKQKFAKEVVRVELIDIDVLNESL